ncbi:MAG: tripartite tricarboxylate transporter permease, partial [Burkholderiales bacterium]|nr:tripartite tricarboxylate transporter permease [Burkholderiales bacterium]
LMAIVLVFPFTFSMTPLEGLSTLIGVYVGGYSGGQISGILLGIPGTPSSICTVFDGYPLAKQGRAGEALGIGIFASFIGGILGGIVMVLFIKPVSEIGLKFGPWELFGLVLFSLTLIATLGGRSFWKGMCSGFLGLTMAMVGTDNTGGVVRLTFDIPELIGGFSLLPVLVGIFALPSLLAALGSSNKITIHSAVTNELTIPYKTVFKRLKENWFNLIRSSALGAFVGALPGEGGSVANFLAYDQAKRYSKHTELFGTGCPDGVVASESGNNACAGGSLIPTLSLGIPGSAADAVLLGVLMVHSIPPGPALFKDSAMLVYGLFVIFFVAHFYMLALQLGIGSRMFLRVTQCPPWAMVPVVLVMCAIGCFALNNQMFDIWLFLIFGILGYLMDRAGFPLAPVIIGLILGGMCEDNLRQAFSINSDWTVFFTRPVSAFFIILTAASIVWCGWQYNKNRKMPEKSQKTRHKVVLACILSCFFLSISTILILKSFELPGASRWDLIGSRLIPQIVIISMGICALMSLLLSLIAFKKDPLLVGEVNLSMFGTVPVYIIFVALILWFLAMPVIGFYLSGLIFLWLVCWYLNGFHFTLPVLLTPPATLVCVYLVFTWFLRVQLPEFPFYF